MDDVVICNKSNEVPRCFKHNNGWQARVQEILNKLRDKYIKTVYMQRFNKLLCTCPGLEYANLWENVSNEELKKSIYFLDDYVSNNTSGELVKLCSSIMIRLRRESELYQEDYKESEDAAPYPRTSAVKLCYLLQKIIEKDFAIMEPRKPAGLAQAAAKQKEEKSLVIDLDEITPGFVKHLIGDLGKNILIFMRKERCRVEITHDEISKKVRATIRKSIYPQDMAKLEKIGENLRNFAQETKDMHDLFERTSGKQQLLTDTTQASTSQAVLSSTAGACGGQEDLSTSSTVVKTENSVASSIPSTGASSYASNTAIATQTDNQSVSQTPTNSQSASQTPTNTMPAPNTYNHVIDPSKAGSITDPCPTSCMVHDRRWLSTYQYTLNQCYKHFGLSRNYGSRLSKLICTCRAERPEARHYFLKEDDMVKEFENCRKILQNWPRECQLIIQPLINQLIKYDRSDIWHSLFKFVYYIHGISGGASDCLRVDHKLPGLKLLHVVPRPEKPYLYQVNFAQQGSQSSSAGTSVTAATGTNSIGTSLGFSSILSSACPSVANNGVNSASGSGSHDCSSTQTCNMNLLKEVTITPTPKKELKRVHADDWSDDCYFHAKKKRSAFQCVVNSLQDNSRLPTYLNKPFCINVCVCNETVDMKEFYPSKSTLQGDCRAMKNKLQMKRSINQSTIQPFIADLEKYLKEDTISDGLMKFVFHYTKAIKGNWMAFEATYELMKARH